MKYIAIFILLVIAFVLILSVGRRIEASGVTYYSDTNVQTANSPTDGQVFTKKMGALERGEYLEFDLMSMVAPNSVFVQTKLYLNDRVIYTGTIHGSFNNKTPIKIEGTVMNVGGELFVYVEPTNPQYFQEKATISNTGYNNEPLMFRMTTTTPTGEEVTKYLFLAEQKGL